jgi:hypothetical protein
MRTAIYFVLPFLFIIANSKELRAQENAEDVTGHFFELFQSKGVDEAVDYIYSTNKWLVSDKTTADNIKMQLKKGIAIIGQYYGYELIGKKALGESYVQMDYMLRYDRQPIKFTFILYKPNKTWQIQNMKPDDRLEDDIENLQK